LAAAVYFGVTFWPVGKTYFLLRADMIRLANKSLQPDSITMDCSTRFRQGAAEGTAWPWPQRHRLRCRRALGRSHHRARGASVQVSVHPKRTLLAARIDVAAERSEVSDASNSASTPPASPKLWRAWRATLAAHAQDGPWAIIGIRRGGEPPGPQARRAFPGQDRRRAADRLRRHHFCTVTTASAARLAAGRHDRDPVRPHRTIPWCSSMTFSTPAARARGIDAILDYGRRGAVRTGGSGRPRSQGAADPRRCRRPGGRHQSGEHVDVSARRRRSGEDAVIVETRTAKKKGRGRS